jgi:hypothetical protein
VLITAVSALLILRLKWPVLRVLGTCAAPGLTVGRWLIKTG